MFVVHSYSEPESYYEEDSDSDLESESDFYANFHSESEINLDIDVDVDALFRRTIIAKFFSENTIVVCFFLANFFKLKKFIKDNENFIKLFFGYNFYFALSFFFDAQNINDLCKIIFKTNDDALLFLTELSFFEKFKALVKISKYFNKNIFFSLGDFFKQHYLFKKFSFFFKLWELYSAPFIENFFFVDRTKFLLEKKAVLEASNSNSFFFGLLKNYAVI